MSPADLVLLENIPSYQNAHKIYAKYEGQKFRSIKVGRLYNPFKISEKFYAQPQYNMKYKLLTDTKET